ncbi:MAG: hypothetical protein QXS66_08945 [Thermoproteota archaeon]
MTLEEIMKEKGISTSNLLKDFGEMIGLPDEPIKLWGKLSQGWVHTRGIVQKILNHIEEKSDFPPYALSIPMNYTDNDVDSLNELAKRTSELRKILKVACDNIRWKYSKNKKRIFLRYNYEAFFPNKQSPIGPYSCFSFIAVIHLLGKGF